MAEDKEMEMDLVFMESVAALLFDLAANAAERKDQTARWAVLYAAALEVQKDVAKLRAKKK